MTALLVFGGCTQDAEDATSFDTWQQEILAAAESAESDFEREALADGSVSDAEFDEVRARLTSCLAGLGYTGVSYSLTGELSADFPSTYSDLDPQVLFDQVDADNSECERSSGESTVGRLYVAVHRNPDHLDEATIIAECLVRRGAVEPGYDAAALNEDSEQGRGPFASEFNEDFSACNADPLGLWTDHDDHA